MHQRSAKFIFALAFLMTLSSANASTLNVTESGVGPFDKVFFFTLGSSVVDNPGITNSGTWIATNVTSHEATATGTAVNSLGFTVNYTGAPLTGQLFFLNGINFVDGLEIQTDVNGILQANLTVRRGPADFAITLAAQTTFAAPEPKFIGPVMIAMLWLYKKHRKVFARRLPF